MRKSVQRDTTFSLGEITNITQDDSGKISNISSAVNRIFIAPLEILAGGFWLYYLVGGWPLFFGSIVMGLSLYVNLYMSKKWQKYQTKTMDSKDKRGKLISEVFSNIRYIKIAGLENYFLEKIVRAKDEELKWIWANFNRATYSITINNGVPLIFLATIFGTYIFIHGQLDVPTIFTVMQVFNIFTFNFRSIPYMLIYVLDIIIAGQRISFFLLSEEIDNSYITHVPKEIESHNYAVEIAQGNFYWEDKTLKRLYKEEKDRIAAKKNQDKNKKDKSKAKPTPEEIQKEKEEKAEKEEKDKIERRLLAIRTNSKLTSETADEKDSLLSRVHSLSDLSVSLNKDSMLQSDTDSLTVDRDLTENLVQKSG